jgi:signal transduction histidine kinase/CheY-like chemotaxis protein
MIEKQTENILLVEQVNLLIRQTNMLLYLIMGVAAAFAGILMLFMPIKIPLIWLCIFYSICIMRLLHNHYNSIAEINEQNVKKISIILILFSALSGITWGALGLVLPIDDNSTIMLYTSLILCGMALAPLATLSIYSPVYIAFSVPLILPISFKCFYIGGDIFTTVGIICLIFLMPSILHSFFVQESYLRAFRLEFENENLIKSLREETLNAEIAKKEAVANSLAKTKFLAAASHDLRQPLHAMGFFVEALNEHANTPKLVDITYKIEQTSEALRGLLDSLLDISRIESGVLVPQYLHIDLDITLRDIHSEYIVRAEQKGIFFEILTSNEMIYSDQLMVERILRNLISNAMKYTDKGYVRVECQKTGNGISVMISDSGAGIPENEKQKIFEEFYQIDNPERDRSKGIGLGLSIVQGLCHLLDLKINLSTSDSGGACFSIVFPEGEKDKVFENKKLEDRYLDVRSKIFIIDDDEDSRIAMNDLIKTWGHDTFMFEGVDDCINHLKLNRLQPNIILTDYRLRDNVTGVNLIEAIHQYLDSNIPAVIITGDTDGERLKEAKKSGHILLHKPLQPAKLRSVISYLL